MARGYYTHRGLPACLPASLRLPQYPVADLKLFGYASATGLKIVVAVKDVLLREDRVRETFKALHR